MIIIEWRGAGPFVILILIIFGILEHFIIRLATNNDEYTQEHYWPLALTFCLAGITTWFIGKYLNKKDLLFKDEATGEIFAIKNFHHFMQLPMQYWAVPMVLGSIIIMGGSYYKAPNNSAQIKVTQPSLVDSISFNSRKLTLKITNKNSKNWATKNGDILTLYYATDELDVPKNNASLKEIRDFYRNKAATVDGAIIEVDKFQIDNIEAIRVIFKTPLENLVMAYTGYLIIPGANAHYIFKMVCQEAGTTGLREANVMAQLKAENQIKINNDGIAEGWSQDPYDVNYQSKLARNLSEDEKYDKVFPRHPLTRLRSLFNQIQPSIKVDAKVRTTS